MKNKTLWCALVAGLVLVGCSDDDDDSSGGAGMDGMAGSSASAGTSSSGGTGGMAGMDMGGMAGMDMGGMAGMNASGAAGMGMGGAGAAGATSGTLQAPKLSMISPMEGALHVMWTNKQDDCDTIEGERKTDTDPYAVAFTVPGEADNKHDMSATKDTTYTYRLRCKKGDAYSEYSNEMSRNPTK